MTQLYINSFLLGNCNVKNHPMYSIQCILFVWNYIRLVNLSAFKWVGLLGKQSWTCSFMIFKSEIVIYNYFNRQMYIMGHAYFKFLRITAFSALLPFSLSIHVCMCLGIFVSCVIFYLHLLKFEHSKQCDAWQRALKQESLRIHFGVSYSFIWKCVYRTARLCSKINFVSGNVIQCVLVSWRVQGIEQSKFNLRTHPAQCRLMVYIHWKFQRTHVMAKMCTWFKDSIETNAIDCFYT